MAQRRMFSPQIVESEEFLTMPVSSQALYFHLGMNADDDGFIQPKIIMRTTGANEDDLKVLLTKRFLLAFDGGVVVIKHWLIHNLIQKDRYHQTRFQEQKNSLFIKENKAYTEIDKPVNNLLTEVRLGKVRLREENTGDKSQGISSKKKYTKDGTDILKAFEEIDAKNKTYYANKTQREACDFLITTYGKEQVLSLIPKLKETNKKSVYQITTPWDMKEKITKVFNDLTRIGENIKSKKTKYYG